MKKKALQRVISRLEERAQAPSPAYLVPGLWLDPHGSLATQSVVPEEYFLQSLRRIVRSPRRKRVTDGDMPGDWGKNAIAYNLLVRYGAAFDHNGDGRIACDPLASGWRETGTFLKAITMLPYIRSLGCNTIHLLPITAIGQDGNKGDMGSAFA
ncbi:MAG TPA: alpha-amylase, partial [Kiritimatiellia bacterium]|nr:alpha-amylase [Kiritimatiellia bacterium]